MIAWAAPVVTTTALYLAWVVATYLLEGLPGTLLRPEATMLRALYALGANVIVGLGGSAMVLAWLARRHPATPAAAGFRSGSRAVVSVLLGATLGGLAYWLQAPPPRPPAVLINSFAQVLTVSAAEVVVCWSLTTAVIAGACSSLVAWRARMLALVPGAVLFGAYHIAHSPPFNTLAMIGLLTGVGLVTGTFYLCTGDVYGTVVFHNFLGLFGVLDAIDQAGRPVSTLLQVPLVIMGLATLVILILVHRRIRRNEGALQVLPPELDGHRNL